ncbi:MAG: Gfo/Idh/MocA family oxidoreductase, partial [Bryobacterales bacterium]|nr:Gfo/Idh/MocA family oxidoreductase [Bryobacterales bacterium]
LIPAFKAAGGRLRTVASNGGVSGLHAGRKFGFAATTTDTATVFADPDVDAVVITTRHDSHARHVIQALRARKAVFVEKPLCLTREELVEIEQACGAASPPTPTLHREGGGSPMGESEDRWSSSSFNLAPCALPLLMVGFNRRFAPQVQKIKALLATVGEPKSFVMTVNAGAIPPEHWTQDRTVGG